MIHIPERRLWYCFRSKSYCNCLFIVHCIAYSNNSNNSNKGPKLNETEYLKCKQTNKQKNRSNEKMRLQYVEGRFFAMKLKQLTWQNILKLNEMNQTLNKGPKPTFLLFNGALLSAHFSNLTKEEKKKIVRECKTVIIEQ